MHAALAARGLGGFGRTLWEKATVARFCILSQEPAVAKVIVAFYQLDAVAAGEREFVRAPSLEFI